jgi:hypothetical protein
MGDDWTPRTVLLGSLNHGHTAVDEANYTLMRRTTSRGNRAVREPCLKLDSSAPAMYSIQPEKPGLQTWSCNSDHILVLSYNSPPIVLPAAAHGCAPSGWYCTRYLANGERDEAGVYVGTTTVIQQSTLFYTRGGAEAERDRVLQAEWPLRLEMSVADFLRAPKEFQEQANMYRPDRPSLPLPASALNASACSSPSAFDCVKSPRCFPFTVTPLPHSEYFGFQLDGNGRCLMADCTVTHNSTLLSTLTNTHSEQAAYEFTTLTCISSDTQVMLADGQAVPAGKVTAGLELAGEDDDTPVKVEEAVPGRSPTMCHIEYAGGSHLVTPDHQVTLRWCRNPTIRISKPSSSQRWLNNFSLVSIAWVYADEPFTEHSATWKYADPHNPVAPQTDESE